MLFSLLRFYVRNLYFPYFILFTVPTVFGVVTVTTETRTYEDGAVYNRRRYSGVRVRRTDLEYAPH